MAIRNQIAAVSYLNTVPFIYGLEHAGIDLRADLLLSPPAQCAEAYASGKADIALIPVGALPAFQDAEIVTSYCIGASGSVRTVTVMSDVPLEQIRRLWLDNHSRTSALLVRILARELWHITPEWAELTDYSVVEKPQRGDGFLLIGDKVFGYEGRFAHTYDLADCWRELTGKPFVFAVWIARRGTDPLLVDGLQAALTFGVEHTWEAIQTYGHQDKPYAYEYLTRNIDYLFDRQKHRALQLFWDKGLKVTPHVHPG